jgi:mycofactocin system creatininase family protein
LGAQRLEHMTWPEVQAAVEAGRDTVVMGFGAVEQHGPHLPLATDVVLADHLAWRVAERLDAFVVPTLNFGCSGRQLGFPGTVSLRASTLQALVHDLVESLARSGMRRIVLLPTHGGSFLALNAAVDRLREIEGVRVIALTEVDVLMELGLVGQQHLGVPIEEVGLHAGEWETSMLLAVEPTTVRMDRAEPGFTGDAQVALGALFDTGVRPVSGNGVLGDPTRACAEHGERYWAAVVQHVVEAVEDEA